MYYMYDFRDYEAMAMLDLPDDERESLSARFDEITGGFSLLDSVCAGNAEPLVSVLEVCNVMREDVAVKMISRDELLESAPEQYDGYFKVPGTLE